MHEVADHVTFPRRTLSHCVYRTQGHINRLYRKVFQFPAVTAATVSQDKISLSEPSESDFLAQPPGFNTFLLYRTVLR